MRVVAALGGNTLLRRGEHADVETQRRNVMAAVAALAQLAAGHELVVTHGNGPQVGLLALQSEAWAVARRRELAQGRTVAGASPHRGAGRDPPADRGRRDRCCVSGGGVPVIERPGGTLHGVEAVIDKDLAAALLARELGAEALLLLTDVPAVELDHGTPSARPLRHASPEELRGLGLASGSMGPKAEAAARFVEAGGRLAAICALADAAQALVGKAGTPVTAEALDEGAAARAAA